MEPGSIPTHRSLQATRASLKRLLERKLKEGNLDPEEIALLVRRVDEARTTDDLTALAPDILSATGMGPRAAAKQERRSAPRRECSFMLRVLEDGSHGMHFIREMGLGGLSLYVQAALPLFPVLHCQLPLYALGKEFAFTARAVWCQPDPPPVVGLQFVEIGDDFMEWLLPFVSS